MIPKVLLLATAVLLCFPAPPVQSADSPQGELKRLGAIHGAAALALRPRKGGEVARLQREDPFTFVIIGEAWSGGQEGLRHLKQLPNLRGVQFSHPEFTDDWLRVLADRTELKEVNLQSPEMTDRGLSHLSKLKNLEALSLVRTGITNEGLTVLKNMANLQWLSLALTDVSDEGMKHLGGLTELRTLQLQYTNVSKAGLDHLKNARKMQVLKLSAQPHLVPGFEKLLHMKDLKELSIGDMLLSGDEKEQMQRLFQATQGLRIIADDTIYTEKGAQKTTRAGRLARGVTGLLNRRIQAGVKPKIDGRINGSPVRLPKELHKAVTEAVVRQLAEGEAVEGFLPDEWRQAREKAHLRLEFAGEDGTKAAPIEILVVLSDERTPSEIWIRGDPINLRFKNSADKNSGGKDDKQWKKWLQKAEPDR